VKIKYVIKGRLMHMGNVDCKGKTYGNYECHLTDAMANMGIHAFRYYPKDKVIVNTQSTMKEYGCKQVYANMPYSFIEEFVEAADSEEYIRMYKAIDEGATRASTVFRTKNTDIMCRVCLSPSEYDEDGQLIMAMGIVENVSEIVFRNEQHTSIIEALGSMYYAMYLLNFEDMTFQEIRTKKNVRNVIGEKGDAKTGFADMVENLVTRETQNAMRVFNEIYTMPERLRRNGFISQEFEGVTAGWSKVYIIPVSENRAGQVTSAIYCVSSIADEKEKMDVQNNLIMALASIYQDVYMVNLHTKVAVAYRMSSEMDLRYGREFVVGDYEKNLGMYIDNEVYEDDQPLFDKVRYIDTINALFTDDRRYAFTYRVDRDGRIFYVQCQVVKPSEDRDEFVLAFKDVDREVRQEQQDKKALDEQQGVIKALSVRYDSVYLVDVSKGTIVPYRMSERNTKEYGELIKNGGSWNQLMHKYADKYVFDAYRDEFKEKTSVENIQNTIAKDDTFVYEYMNDRPGERSYYRIKAVSMPWEKGRHIVIGFTDVSKEREQELAMQNALKDAYKSAKAANSAKSDFLANMSHDIRTPLNGIIGMTAIAGTHIDDQKRVQECLKKITASSKHLLSLVNEVLDISKIESGKIDMAEEDFLLPELIDNMLTMVNPQVQNYGHQLFVNIKNVKHEKVIGDSLRIQQLFVNLISNSIKYTPKGGKISVTLTELPTNQNKVGYYEAIFEDNGIGMSEEYVRKIFEPFSRAEDERVGKVQGTGLGMAISRNIVHMMGGDIEVCSKLNQGTRITATFFLKLQEVEEVSYEALVNLSVLVADDDDTSTEIACDILTELGMNAEGVSSGEEAIKRVVKQHEQGEDFFAIILDWKMPDMDGIETTREIRRIVGEEVPIIIISAYDWSYIEQEARLAGANAFISKPLFKSRVAHLFKSLVGAEEEQVTVDTQKFSDMDLRGYRILLVEDNELNAEIATELLSMTGITVEQAKDGVEAVDMVRDRRSKKADRYDVILMDIQMPRMNGYDATRAIRSLDDDYCRKVPIIAMTANAFAEDVQAALSAGMNEHIAKPIDLDVLAAVLNKWGIK
jgi:signal transduction histidine kinase/CheY-like chemotaxis protein